MRFFEAVGKAAKPRRQTEKSDSKTKHIEDIFKEIEMRDVSGAFLPVFVALRLHNIHNIPLTPDGSVSNAQILEKLKSLHKDCLQSVKSTSSLLPRELHVIPTPIQSENTLWKSPASPRTPGRRLPPRPDNDGSRHLSMFSFPTTPVSSTFTHTTALEPTPTPLMVPVMTSALESFRLGDPNPALGVSPSSLRARQQPRRQSRQRPCRQYYQ